MVRRAGARRFGAAVRRGPHARAHLLCRGRDAGPLRGGELGAYLRQPVRGPGAGIDRILGGTPRPLWPVSAVHWSASLVARRHGARLEVWAAQVPYNADAKLAIGGF